MASRQPSDAEFESIRQSCLKTGKLWEDPLFTADDSSIFRRPGSQPKPSGFVWKRPREISRTKKPTFILEGASRFDIVQGGLGDCWMLAAAANLSRFPVLFDRLVPPKQSFDEGWYAGVFHFRFWKYGEWTDVLVDDRLPTQNGKLVYVQSEATNEFWGALLEKAFAKFYGSYEAIEGGYNADSLTDFTGGVVETFDLQAPPRNLATILSSATKRRSIMSAAIFGDARRNPVHSNGLVSGHAYSITGYSKVTEKNGDSEDLVRIRNPWGTEVEWNGRWSDSSKEWRKLTAEERQKLGLVKDDDGEFWMSLSDFVKNFHSLDICNLSPDDLSDKAITWAVSMAHAEWTPGVSAGGRIMSPSFSRNPQFHVSALDHDADSDAEASFVVQVLQKNCRRRNLPYETLGVVVYRVPPGAKLPLDAKTLERNRPVEVVAQYRPQPAPLRMLVERFEQKPGDYVIIPTTWNVPPEERQFMVRVFVESVAAASRSGQ